MTKKTVDERVILLAFREFISECDAETIAELTSKFFGVNCTPNDFDPFSFDIEPNEKYMGAFDSIFEDEDM